MTRKYNLHNVDLRGDGSAVKLEQLLANFGAVQHLLELKLVVMKAWQKICVFVRFEVIENELHVILNVVCMTIFMPNTIFVSIQLFSFQLLVNLWERSRHVFDMHISEPPYVLVILFFELRVVMQRDRPPRHSNNRCFVSQYPMSHCIGLLVLVFEGCTVPL